MIERILSAPLRAFYDRIFNPVYKQKLAEIAACLIPEWAQVLDFGCDDGSVAAMMMEVKPSLNIIGVDIQANRPAKISRDVYDGVRLPYESGRFDCVMALDVLHHSENIPRLLCEMARVSKKTVLIKDHVIYSKFSHYLVSFTDYTSNFPYGIECAYNFPTFEQWYAYFKQANLQIVEQPEGLSFGFGLNERYNPVFKLEKKE